MALPTLQEPRGAFGSLLEGLDLGLKQAAPSIQEMILSRRKQQAGIQKDVDESRKYLNSALPKAVFNKYGDKIDPIYKKYLQQGLTRDEARDRAVGDVTGRKRKGEAFEEGEGSDLREGLGNTGLEALMKSLSTAGKEAPGAALQSLPFAGGALGSALGFPTAGAGAIAAPALLELARHKGVGLTPRELIEGKKPAGKETYFENPLSSAASWLDEKAREGKTPEERQKAEETKQVLSSVMDALLLLSPSKGAKRGAISPDEILPAEKPGQIELKRQPISPKTGKPATKVTPPLEGKVTKAPETATESRVARVNPEARIYPRLEKVELAEQQLKNYPKYVAEMETDAAERAARKEARIPKTVKGMDSQRIRIHEAEKQWPLAQESYNKAAGRVRALEDEVVKLKGSQRESAETLLDMAKKELDDATFDLKQAWENLEGTNYRATSGEMRDAARNKIQQIQDTVAKGEEYKIHKRDYSPDLIAKAQAISKSKPLPKARQSDFYTQVHDVYANEYRNQVSKIDKELASLPKTMQGMFQAKNLQAEKDILNKMIKSAEAEKTIQNRRFGLREMAERHKAQERFKQLKQINEKPEVSNLANQKMWRGRFEEAKTSESRGAVFDDAVEQVANEHPEQAEKIRAEGQKLKDSIEELFKTRPPKEPPRVKGERTRTRGRKTPEQEAPPKGKGIPKEEELQTKSKSAKQAAKESLKWVRDFQDKVDDLLGKVPILGKHWVGKDLIIGAIGAAVDELHKEYELPITGGDITNVIFGRAFYGVRWVTRKWAKNLTKWAIKRVKEEKEVYDYVNS
jgi:hypothetical protein